MKYFIERIALSVALACFLALVAMLAFVAIANATPAYHGRFAVLHSRATIHPNTTFTSDDYFPQGGTTISFFLDADRTGTARFYRVDSRGATHQIGSNVSVTGGTELVQTLTAPYNQIRVTYVATSTTSTTTFSLEANEGPKAVTP